jgi:hypothetical protein
MSVVLCVSGSKGHCHETSGCCFFETDTMPGLFCCQLPHMHAVQELQPPGVQQQGQNAQQPRALRQRRQQQRQPPPEQSVQPEAGDGEILQMYQVDEPAEPGSELQVASPMFYSPGGGFRSGSVFASRAVTSPGEHVRSWWHGEEQQQQHVAGACAAQPWRTQLVPQQQQSSQVLQPPGAAAAAATATAAQQQQQQPPAVQQQAADSGQLALLQHLRQHVGQAGMPLLDSLEQQLVSTSQAPAVLEQQQQRQQQQQQQAMLQAAAAAFSHPMLQLSGNPFGFLEPHIGSLPSTAAALGYRPDMGRQAQAMVALGDYLGITWQLGCSSSSRGWEACSTQEQRCRQDRQQQQPMVLLVVAVLLLLLLALQAALMWWGLCPR